MALVISTLQVLKQTMLGFELSVTQILVYLETYTTIEINVALQRDRILL